MIRQSAFVFVCVFGLTISSVAQQPDMAAMEKWLSAKHASWNIVGKYDADTSVSSDGQGMGKVTDTIEFTVVVDWQNGNTIVGTPAIKNAPSVVANLHDREPKCKAPTLQGAFDKATLDAVTEGIATALHLKITTTYPVATVSQVCSSTKTAPAKKTTDEVELFLPQPTMLAMGMSNGTMSVSPDKKSIVLKNPPGLQGWTWTLTPTPR